MAKLGLQLNTFIQDDENTFYYVNGLLQRTSTVKENPDVLRYPLNDTEKGKSAGQLFDMALWKVNDTILLSKYCHPAT